MTLLLVTNSKADLIIIGGSDLKSPPSFWENSYWGMTSDVERAFPFTTISGSSFYAEEIQIAAFYFIFQPGSQARFTVHLDDNGLPGEPIFPNPPQSPFLLSEHFWRLEREHNNCIYSPTNSSNTCLALSLSASLDFYLELTGPGW